MEKPATPPSATQIEGILEINSRIVLTKEVVEAARETLVIGQV
jgi:hypothetical protein